MENKDNLVIIQKFEDFLQYIYPKVQKIDRTHGYMKQKFINLLFEEVEYVGINNFRDHMWTEFRKDLDLPIGTTIKFKGEIYDYERNYLGKKEEDKNGQSIKIIDLLEIDTSTRKRVKLYE